MRLSSNALHVLRFYIILSTDFFLHFKVNLSSKETSSAWEVLTSCYMYSKCSVIIATEAISKYSFLFEACELIEKMLKQYLHCTAT